MRVDLARMDDNLEDRFAALLRDAASAPDVEPRSSGSHDDVESTWRVFGVRPGDVLARRYRIRRLLGTGGMGAVFEAENTALERRVAIKVLRAEVGAEERLVTRFKREALAASRVEHPNIVEVLDFDIDQGRPYMVMEMLEGETLRAKMQSGETLPLTDLVALLRPAIEGLGHAHELGVVHRDVKPENIFVARTDEGSTVKVLDFGIAKLSLDDDSRLTLTQQSPGTPAYMAPEQIVDGAPVGPASDQYAIATILYEGLTGKLPFEAGSRSSLLVAKARDAPRQLRRLRGDLPRGLCDAIMRSLSTDPADRFDSIDELGAALDGRGLRPKRAQGAGGRRLLWLAAVALTCGLGAFAVWAGQRPTAASSVAPKLAPIEPPLAEVVDDEPGAPRNAVPPADDPISPPPAVAESPRPRSSTGSARARPRQRADTRMNVRGPVAPAPAAQSTPPPEAEAPNRAAMILAREW